MNLDAPEDLPLDRYGLEGADAVLLPGGMVNLTYKVTQGESVFALKWYRPGLRESQPERLRFVCGSQETMRRAGVPVPGIIPDGEGSLFTETSAGRFVLNEYVAGVQYPRGAMPLACARAMGRTLHALLGALSGLPPSVPIMPLKPDEAMLRLEEVRRRLEGIAVRSRVDSACLEIVRDKMRRLTGWRAAVPSPEAQWIHGDYQDTNVIFDTSFKVAAIVDWDAIAYRSAAHEVMRAFSFSFPEGAQGGNDFLRGYIEVARPSPEEVAAMVDLWDYTSMVRLWPIETRYLERDVYQDRWDVFIQSPTGWWEANRDVLRQRVRKMASAARAE